MTMSPTLLDIPAPRPPSEPRSASTRPATETRSTAATVVIGLLLGIVVPGLVLVSTPAADIEALTAARVVQSVATLHAALALTWVLTAPGIRVVQLGFWLFGYVWLGLAPTAMLAADDYPWLLSADPSTALHASLLVWASFLAYTAGVVLAGRRGPRTGLLERGLDRAVVPSRVILLSLAAIVLAVVTIPRVGGLEVFFSNREEIDRVLRGATESAGLAGRALLKWPMQIVAFWALVGLLLIRPRSEDGTLVRQARLVLLPVIALLNVVVNNPITQPRFWVGTVLLTLVLLHRYARSVRGFRVVAASLVAGSLLVFPMLDYFRAKTPTMASGSAVQQLYSNGDYDVYQQLQAGIEMVDAVGHQPDWVLGPALFWLPRAVWPDKPTDTGAVVARYTNYEYDNLSAPLVLEAHVWGGGLIVVLLFLGLGRLARRLDVLYESARHNPATVAALLIPAVGIFQIIVLRGSLLQATGPLLLLIAVPLLISSRRTAPSATPAELATPVTELATPVTEGVTR